jgi:hypothetical protein
MPSGMRPAAAAQIKGAVAQAKSPLRTLRTVTDDNFPPASSTVEEPSTFSASSPISSFGVSEKNLRNVRNGDSACATEVIFCPTAAQQPRNGILTIPGRLRVGCMSAPRDRWQVLTNPTLEELFGCMSVGTDGAIEVVPPVTGEDRRSLEQPPAWAPDLPVACEAHLGSCYTA